MISFPFESKNVSGLWDRAITAEMERNLNKMTWTNGIFATPANGFLVSASGGMRLSVSPGGCHIEGARAYEKSTRSITLGNSHDSLNRIDRIVLRFDTSETRRDIDLFVKEGTPSTRPTAQSLIQQPNYYELAIADIYVAARTTEIASVNITDKRLDPSVCGLVLPAIPYENQTRELWTQISDSISLVESSLDGTTAGNLRNEITKLKSSKADITALNTKANQGDIANLTTRVSSLEAKDQIIEKGTWTIPYGKGEYIKYKSGRVELTGYRPTTIGSSSWKAWGSLYYVSVPAINYPPSLFVERPVEVQSVSLGDNGVFSSAGENSQSTTGNTAYLRPSTISSNITPRINYHIVGRWK